MNFVFAMVIIALVLLCVPAIYFLIMSAIADRAAGIRNSPGPGGFEILPPTMSLRLVILHHTGIPTPHYDLMFETDPGSPLATWRSPTWPITQPTMLERINDHRRDYLDYEGPVTNDRGQVTRIAAGTFRFESRTDHRWVIITDLGLNLTFRQEESPNWRVEVGQNR